MKLPFKPDQPARKRFKVLLIIGFFVGLGICTGQPKPVPQTKKQPKVKLTTKAELRAAEFQVPFREGERLSYRVMWTRFLLHAANIEVAARERRPFYGKEAWHFQAVARTIDAMRLLYALDDQLDGYADVASLETMQFELYLREQGKNEDSKFQFSVDGRQGTGNGAIARVREGTRDPLAYLYLLRTVNWEKIGRTTIPVYDGRRLYEVKARREVERGTVSVPAGIFTASRIEVRVYEKEKEVRQTRFWVWLAHNAENTPVLIEVEIPFGTGRVELVKAEGKN